MVLIGDDYPSKWKNLPINGAVDSWGMYTRQCTSFVANRLSVVNKFNISRPPSNWNANVWGQNAQSMGYKVDKNPSVGSVAWWNAGFHVAWVAEVKNGQVLIEEYNNPAGSGRYNNRWINSNNVDGYIHFKDLPTTGNSNYYEVNPGSVMLKKADGLYGANDVDFKNGAVLGTFAAGTKFFIQGIKKSSAGIPRLVTGSGHLLTANKSLVEQCDLAFPNYFNVNPVQVELQTEDGLYAATDRDFKNGLVGNIKYKKGTPFYITGLTYNSTGYPRLITSSGHLLSSNKAVVKVYSGSMFTNYFATNPVKVELKTTDGLYSRNDVDFKNGLVNNKTYNVGTPFYIVGMTQSSSGHPRLITSSGHLLSSNKAVVKVYSGAMFTNYFATNPVKVELKTTDGLYSRDDVDFKNGLINNKTYNVGTPFYIVGMTQSSSGHPRLITSSGDLLSSSKSIVKVYSGLLFNNYYPTNPGRVRLKVADGVYAREDVDFKNGCMDNKIYDVGSSFIIIGMTQSSTGIPRLITNNGYLLSANKSIVEAY
jgi:surface antigen